MATKMTAKRQPVCRKPRFFRLDNANDARLTAMQDRYAALMGCPVSLSLILPRALVALEAELEASLNRIKVNDPNDQAPEATLKHRERFILQTLTPV